MCGCVFAKFNNSLGCDRFVINGMLQPIVGPVAVRKCCRYFQIRRLHFWPHQLYNVDPAVRNSRPVVLFACDTYLNAF